ncbi:unnamed protein product [Brassicogethes aeneus]|uniref:Uncharacterized protein n=1 Tax=Brassicogethes aeneus TaxID=1431903 RepID=A0A9P0BD62_BRAAE|nr:unnamed protein product [Brassicogethes aeneus]
MEQKINLCGEQYNLKWNSFTKNLIEVIQEKQICEALTDVSIYCEGQIVKAHKIILAASSSIFEDMFKFNIEKHPYIIFNGVTLKNLKYIIEFIYNGEIKVLDCDLQDVLSLGETLQIKGLSSVKVKENPNNNTDVSTSNAHSKNKFSKNARKSTIHSAKDALPPEVPSVSAAAQLKYVENNYFQEIAEGVVKWQKVDKNIKEFGKDSIINLNENIPPKKRKIVEENIEKPQDLSSQVKLSPVVIKQKSPETLSTKSNTSYNDVSPPKIEKPFSKAIKVEQTDLNKTPVNLVKNKPQKDVPQPPKNAFMIFTNKQRDKIAAENPNKSYKDISIMLGDMWKSLPEYEKQIYYSQADGMPSKSKFSNHYYSPKEHRKLKTIEKMSTTTGCVEIEIPDDDPVETIDVTGDTVNTIQIAPDFFS